MVVVHTLKGRENWNKWIMDAVALGYFKDKKYYNQNLNLITTYSYE